MAGVSHVGCREIWGGCEMGQAGGREVQEGAGWVGGSLGLEAVLQALPRAPRGPGRTKTQAEGVQEVGARPAGSAG